MQKQIFCLYPPPFSEVPLKGLYLGHRLFELGLSGRPFVYANFLASLDGRIALEDMHTGQPYLPKSLTTPADFRLFLELEAQADCLITHGGYLRALAEGTLGNILQLGAHPAGGDLVAWRQSQGLKPQPAIAIASGSLDFVIPESVRIHHQPVYLFTGEGADPVRVEAWRKEGYPVIFAGSGRLVEGRRLISILGQLGYRSIYLIAGPAMLDTVLRSGQLDRLYQTITHQLMGGEAFRTMLPGPELGLIGHLRLRSLYYDPAGPGGAGQWFAQFDSQ
ncbi:MAG: RibD family protein [Methylohalobius sp. ZOD2]